MNPDNEVTLHRSEIFSFSGHTGIPGLWTQELDAGPQTLDTGPWTLDSGRQTLNPGRWTLDVER